MSSLLRGCSVIIGYAGQRVFQQWTAGNRLSFQGLDNTGWRLANGVYLFVVTARGYDGQVQRSEVKKEAGGAKLTV